MTPTRWTLLFLTLWGLVILLGCSEGEVIPLVPSGIICERPLDHSWQEMTNICQSKHPMATVWPPGEMPVVVGENGLILQCDASSVWSVVDLSIHENLKVVAGNDEGDLVAAGTGGALAYRKDNQWHTMDPLAETTWRDVRAHDRQMWLAGDGGMLASGRPGSAWEMVSVPDSTDLYSVCAFEDSVFTGGAGGLLRVLVNNQWEDLTRPEFDGWRVRSIVRLDDGRLVVWANGLWVRGLDGWHQETQYGTTFNNHMEVRGGYLWIMCGYYRCYRLDLFMDPWEAVDCRGYGNTVSLAPGPDTQALVMSEQGQFTWLSLDAENNILRQIDSAGYLDTDHLFRLEDGSVVFPVDNGLFEVNSTGVTAIPNLSPEVVANLSDHSRIHGASVSDFYSVWDMKLCHILGGEVVLVADIPEEYGNPGKLLVNQQGQVCLGLSSGVIFWTGSQWEVWSEESYNQIFLTQQQNFVITSSNSATYHGPSGTVSTYLGLRTKLAWEPEPGVLEFMSDDFTLARWQTDAAVDPLFYLNPMPHCSFLYATAIKESSLGVLAVTFNHSMVLTVPDDPNRVDWELVAGPSLHEISDLQVLEDGNLVALSHHGSYIMYYSPVGN